MFRRSLILFGAVVLLVLAIIIGYAALGMGGPHVRMSEARAAFADGKYLRVVNDLDQYERSVSLQRDPPKFQELLSLRYRSQLALDNAPAALRDLDRLIAELGAATEELRLDHIRVLAKTGAGELALQEARTFLADNPDHGRGLELAGEACQTAYRDELRAVQATVELDIGAAVARQTARPALLSYLYRPEADDEVRQAIASLQQIYTGQAGLVAAWPPLRQRLERLRARVQEALAFFQRSLECEGEPVAAFLFLSLSLEQAQRIDDLLILCECYRRRYDHQYVLEAGARAAWALVSEGLDAAAIATANRWLLPGTAEVLYAEGKIRPGIAALWGARVVAAWRQRDRGELQRIQRDASALNRAADSLDPPQPPPAQLAAAVAGGLHQYLREDENCAAALDWATNLALKQPPQHGEADLLAILIPIRVDWLRSHGGSADDITALFKTWKNARPSAVEPLLALASWQIEAGKPAAAMSTLQQANTLQPDHEAILAIRIRAARELYRDTNQDGPGLLAQCRQRRTPLPDVPDPVCYLLCAEAALALEVAPVALSCARAASDALPWSRAGRVLEARAELLAGRPLAAATLLRKLVEARTADRATLQLAIAAHRAADQPLTDLLWRALRTSPPDPDLAAEILIHAADDAASVALPFATAVLREAGTPARVRVLAAAAFGRANQTELAERTLRSIPRAELEALDQRAELAAAIASLLASQAQAGADDAALARRARRLIAEFDLAAAGAAPVLLQLGKSLAELHPQTAWFLVATAIGAADPEDRTGASYALAGSLALRTGQLTLAEQHCLAAVSFDDGRTAAELLARICFATERPERALQVYRLVTNPTDAALALRCGDARNAEIVGANALRRDPTDLLAHATMAAAGLPSALADLAPADQPERDALLELATLLRTPELADKTLQRAQKLASQKPTVGTRLLLARANAIAGNTAAAAKLHSELWLAGERSPLFWREVAFGSTLAGYEPAPVVHAEFATAARTGDFAAAPYSFAVATMLTADLIEAGGKAPAVAAQLRTAAWLSFDPDRPFPEKFRPRLSDLDALRATGSMRDAWWVLDRLRPTLSGAERRQCVEHMLAIARDGESFSAQEKGTIYAAVAALAASEGPYGCIVHFLIEHGAEFPHLQPPAARRLQLLRGHLPLVASGRDSDALTRATVDLIVTESDPGLALEVVEGALAEHPTALALWLERTRLLGMLRRSDEGVEDLRRVLAHAAAPQHRLTLVTRAAAQFALLPEDVTWLEQCGNALCDSPDGFLARGLVALRTGRPDDAVALLDRAAPVGGALRQLALAQALLQSKLDDSMPRAIALFGQLATEHAGSTEARYAASFARILTQN